MPCMIRTWAVGPLVTVTIAVTTPAAAAPAAITSPSLNRADLMRARFDGWTSEKPWGWRLTVPDGIEWSPWLPVAGNSEKIVETDTLSIVPLHVIRFDETHAALVTVSSPVDDDGQILCGHSCSHFIGVDFFTASGGLWRETKRIDAAAWVALFPSNNWVQKWDGHGYIVSFTSGSCWGGACTDAVVLLGLQPDRLLPLLGTSLNESNEGEAAAGSDEPCGDFLIPGWRPSRSERFDPALDCREAKGAWRLNGDQVVFTFHGQERKADSHGRLKPLASWMREVTLALQGDKLVPVSGELPTFGF